MAWLAVLIACVAINVLVVGHVGHVYEWDSNERAKQELNRLKAKYPDAKQLAHINDYHQKWTFNIFVPNDFCEDKHVLQLVHEPCAGDGEPHRAIIVGHVKTANEMKEIAQEGILLGEFKKGDETFDVFISSEAFCEFCPSGKGAKDDDDEKENHKEHEEHENRHQEEVEDSQDADGKKDEGEGKKDKKHKNHKEHEKRHQEHETHAEPVETDARGCRREIVLFDPDADRTRGWKERLDRTIKIPFWYTSDKRIVGDQIPKSLHHPEHGYGPRGNPIVSEQLFCYMECPHAGHRHYMIPMGIMDGENRDIDRVIKQELHKLCLEQPKYMVSSEYKRKHNIRAYKAK